MICLNKDNEKYHYTSKLSKQKNAPIRGKFQVRLKMREIGSVADDHLLFSHCAPFAKCQIPSLDKMGNIFGINLYSSRHQDHHRRHYQYHHLTIPLHPVRMNRHNGRRKVRQNQSNHYYSFQRHSPCHRNSYNYYSLNHGNRDNPRKLFPQSSSAMEGW